MSVQKKEKATWEMLDRFFLRVLREKEGTAVMAESREQAASFLAGSQETSPLPACPYAKHDPAAGRSLHCIEAPGAGC